MYAAVLLLQWYMVTLVHVYNRWKNSEISCYVNGELASFGDIAWFVNTSDVSSSTFVIPTVGGHCSSLLWISD